MAEYRTWYEFKKELEKEAGRTVLNESWLNIKPAAPLPWNRSHLRNAVARLERVGSGKSR